MSKKLEEYTKEELLAYVRQLQKDTKFGLVWNPKQEQVAIDCETKVPVLQAVADKTITKAASDEPTHLLIEGDNYHSLSVLNYTHAGKIDVIYIDPPYNTGNKDFIYNDHFIDKEDAFRHSKWLSFMNNRLRLAKDLLADTGVIFISIDDNEYAHLKILCDKVLGEENFVANFIWNHRKSSQNDTDVSLSHNYTLCYAKKRNNFKLNPLAVDDGKFSNPDNDPRGDWTADPFDAPAIRANLEYPVTNPNTGQTYQPPSGRHWRFTKEKYEKALAENKVVWGKSGKGRPQLKRFLSEAKGKNPFTIWSHVDTATNATKELMKIFDDKKLFDTPKPVGLITEILKIGGNKDSVVLDFFAGSGTTGHAVLKLNAEDGGKRQFILGTNNENGIAENITYERISRVINGYSNVDGIPANLHYFKTDFVDTNGLNTLTDHDKLEITREMGAMIALRENSFDQIEQTDHWQTYENSTQLTAIYYREDKNHMQEYLDKLNIQDKPVKLYVFGWGKNAGSEYASKKITVEDIPEPLIEVYKEIAK